MNGMNQMYIGVPFGVYPIQAIQTSTNPNSTVQSPRSNADNNKDNNETEERKSDTTTTTSNSTIPNGITNGNSANTTPTPGINASAAAILTTTPTAPLNAMVYNPYLNPYLMPMNMNMMGFNQFALQPPVDIHLSMNQMQLPPSWDGEENIPEGPYYVLKVSCVATGYGADDRAVGHIALIDWNLKTKANVFVKPEADITSYIEPLTSLNKELLDKYGYELEAAINIIKSELPSNAVVIGQNINMDFMWLGLKQNQDYRHSIDLRDLWRSWSDYYKSYTHYSLSHQAKCILNYQNADQQKHSASYDGITEMKLFQYYLWCRYYNMQLFNSKIQTLKNTTIEPSFAKKHPTYEGVQMQSKKYKGVPYITNTKKLEIKDPNLNDGNDKNDDNNMNTKNDDENSKATKGNLLTHQNEAAYTNR